MNEILFTANARALLRRAGWFPGRAIPISACGAEIELLPSAIEILRELGDVSLRTGEHELLIFGPGFDSGDETNISERVVSRSDRVVAKTVWASVTEQIRRHVSVVAWEYGQDQHSIAVDKNGLVYCATWSFFDESQTVNADVIKLADCVESYLNFWLDPNETTRSNLHVAYPFWETSIEFCLE